MAITGIICEYNPFHLGHKKQLDAIRAANPDGSTVCLMSGNFVQRGAPAIFDKISRARAAIAGGADLVLELPVTYALRSAEGFASGGVEILSRFCDELCFGAENADPEHLMQLVQALTGDDFPPLLRSQLEKGLSFPAARQAALAQMGMDASILSLPNNILAVEYCKAILQQKSPMKPHIIHRQGSYHDTAPDPENPSATALRTQIENNSSWEAFVPDAACFTDATIHTLGYGEKAVLYRLRTMTEEEFSNIPFGSEGLWRKLMHASRNADSLESILAEVKSKRYTRSRLDRMVMCAFLGITEQMLSESVPYVRVLAFNDNGRAILKKARQNGQLINIGETQDHPYQYLEDRCDLLYGLFSQAPEATEEYRVFYHKKQRS